MVIVMKRSRYAFHLFLLISGVVLCGCTREDDSVLKDVIFNRTTVAVTGRATRSVDVNDGYSGIEASDSTIYLANTDNISWGTIHIHLYVDESDKGTQPYNVKSGAYGELASAGGGETLKWQNSTAEHTFHAWNSMESPSWPVTIDVSGTTGTVDFNGGEASNSSLEYFIGTRTGPLTYKANGLSVSMEFRHLVSKICINSITRVKSDGSKERIYGSSFILEFPKMPQQGIFDTGIAGDKFPTVSADAGSGSGIAFKVFSNWNYYLPPFEFADYGDFIITIAEQEGDYFRPVMYYGNLADISGLKGLQAGEAMVLDLLLSDGKVTGISVYIIDWNDISRQDVSMPARTGIYSYEDLYDAIANNNLDAYCVEEDGKKVIRIYNNITIPASITGVPIPDGYILDGQGHNIIANEGLSFSGEVRNLYLNGLPV